MQQESPVLASDLRQAFLNELSEKLSIGLHCAIDLVPRIPVTLVDDVVVGVFFDPDDHPARAKGLRQLPEFFELRLLT